MPHPGRYVGVGERAGHWWFIDPEGAPFFSIGMNHIDSAALRYKESGGIWRMKFGNSEKRWIQEDERGEPIEPIVREATEANPETLAWVRQAVP